MGDTHQTVDIKTKELQVDLMRVHLHSEKINYELIATLYTDKGHIKVKSDVILKHLYTLEDILNRVILVNGEEITSDSPYTFLTNLHTVIKGDYLFATEAYPTPTHVKTEITREQLIEWAKNQGAHLLGRAYSSKDEGDREKFADWFLNIYNKVRT